MDDDQEADDLEVDDQVVEDDLEIHLWMIQKQRQEKQS
jgi:hypothetical protein